MLLCEFFNVIYPLFVSLCKIGDRTKKKFTCVLLVRDQCKEAKNFSAHTNRSPVVYEVENMYVCVLIFTQKINRINRPENSSILNLSYMCAKWFIYTHTLTFESLDK